MQLANVLFDAIAIVILARTHAENITSSSVPSVTSSPTENTGLYFEYNQIELLTHHTFVALIDIVFTDDEKKTCTGSIIHDNVVITAAHCFLQEIDLDIKPELTETFVVVGTKHMFDTGYEQYLPIERIITHPKFSGRRADLSLVYTFASMVSDKPGTILPIGGQKILTHMDTNVTVMSWEQTKPTALEPPHIVKLVDDVSSHESQSTEGQRMTMMRHRSNQNTFKKGKVKLQRKNPSVQLHSTVKQKQQTKLSLVERARSQNTKLTSRYLMGGKRKSSAQDALSKNSPHVSIDARVQNIEKYYKNWRRSIGSQQNTLVVEKFGFVNFESCKLMVQNSMSSSYNLTEGNDDVVCFSNERRDLYSDISSGAPAVKHGLLVAVLVGGIQYDGDYVAVGMKMSCYCKWIAENLPDRGSNIQCCTNCCDEQHKEESNGTLAAETGRKHRNLN